VLGGCDRLARIAAHLGPRRARAALGAQARVDPRGRARARVERVARQLRGGFDGDELDASLLLLPELGFLPATTRASRRRSRRSSASCAAATTLPLCGRRVRRGAHAFNVCTFWYIDALARRAPRRGARAVREHARAAQPGRAALEDLDRDTGELWGNFPQTYSLVGLINSAMRLSKRWEEAL
jgi:GH15 family glucan-1,4-alpha-glucosidase